MVWQLVAQRVARVVSTYEMTWRTASQVVGKGAVRSGMVLFIVAAAQSLTYVLTLQQIPHAVADFMVQLSSAHGTWVFLLLSVLILIFMGSVLEGAAALIIFGPLLMPVARQLGIDPLHYGIILVIAWGPACSRRRSASVFTAPA
jgi:TRAP-type C4-dicarboxylate transport system permease large subunit